MGEARHPAELAALRPDPNDPTLLIFTSGTTGEPKGVVHTHNTLMAANAPLPDRLGVGPDDVIHMASTFAHLTGFLYGVRLPVQVGGATAVYQDVWNAEEFAGAGRGAPDHLHLRGHAVPARHPERAVVRDPRPLVPAALLLLRRADPAAHRPRGPPRLPGLTVLGGWGQSENALVTLGIPGDPEEKIVERDGYPLPGMEIRVVDFDGTPLPAGRRAACRCGGRSCSPATCTAPS